MKTNRPKKRWGQNFLTDPYTMQRIVSGLNIAENSLILEIGPGKGALTRYLLELQRPYIGIEIDPGLASSLRRDYGSNPYFSLLEGDILDLDFAALLAVHRDKQIAVIGNIPYNITSPILFRLFEHHTLLHQAVLMTQKEVAERIAATHGGKTYGLLAINSQIFCEVTYLFTVAAGLFYPKPKVDSAVCHFSFRSDALQNFSNFPLFRRITRTAFQHRRKMLRKSLSMLFPPDLLGRLDADLTRRPEQLSIGEWHQLCEQANTLLQRTGDGTN